MGIDPVLISSVSRNLSIKRRPVWTFLQLLHTHLSATNHLQMRYSFPITVYHMPRHVPHTYIN